MKACMRRTTTLTGVVAPAHVKSLRGEEALAQAAASKFADFTTFTTFHSNAFGDGAER